MEKVINFVVFFSQSEKLALMESMKQELEEKIRKLEEDKQNMDISAGKVSSDLICRSGHETKEMAIVTLIQMYM